MRSWLLTYIKERCTLQVHEAAAVLLLYLADIKVHLDKSLQATPIPLFHLCKLTIQAMYRVLCHRVYLWDLLSELTH